MSPGSEKDFEQYRSHLRGIAYRMMGSLSESEDVLQEAYLRWRSVSEEVRNPQAYLSTLVTRLCLDWLKSARARRETYVGTWLPEPVVDERTVHLDADTELAQDVSMALLLALERLSPLERAAFLLHDVFDEDYETIAATLSKSEEACRQLAARARVHVRNERPRHRPTQDESARISNAFLAARLGDTRSLEMVLAEDATLYSDGGGRVLAARKPIRGKSRILRFLAGVSRKYVDRVPVEATPTTVNGLPGLLLAQEGLVIQTLAFDIRDGRLVTIFAVRNPDKLAHVSVH
ncbi:MAG: sigma-70 family RNA polymerase sigma factor [Polyangiaceae bacterium]